MTVDETVEMLKALADPTRLRIASLLSEHGMLCVCELEEVTEVAQYSVSRHLGILRRAGLVEGQRDGARRDYVLRDDLPEAVRQLLAGAVAAAADDEQVQADRAAARRVRPACCNSAA